MRIDMENDIRLRYGNARYGVFEGTLTMLVLSIGSRRTAVDFFTDTPFLPGEFAGAHWF